MGCGLCGSMISGLVLGIASLGSFMLILLGQLMMALASLLRGKQINDSSN